MPPIEDSSRLRNAPPPHSFVDRTVTAIPHRTREVLMSTNEVHSNDAARNAGVARIDMKLEVVVIPVSDVDRAKAFYERIGWRLNMTAPPAKISAGPVHAAGLSCAVHFGKNVTPAAPGSAKAFRSLPTSRRRDWSPPASSRRASTTAGRPGQRLHPKRLSYRRAHQDRRQRRHAELRARLRLRPADTRANAHCVRVAFGESAYDGRDASGAKPIDRLPVFGRERSERRA